ncbi:hypothetical protein ACIBEK_35830 [Nocardia fusca]|uniref:hypothetical protein n=1 Tax=Nocardia fusca TaxID=941183 RepID=UPI00379A6CBD
MGASVPHATHLLDSAALVLDREAIARAEAARLSQIIAPYRREYPDVPVEERSLTKSAANRPGEEAESRNHGQLATLWPTF